MVVAIMAVAEIQMRMRVMLTAVAVVLMTSAPAFAQTAAPTAPERNGFWFNAGFGYGSLGCDDCSGREGSGTASIAFGGTINERFLLGIGINGWGKDILGETLSTGTFDFRVRFYPVRTSGFFVTGGVGAGGLSYGDQSETGVGVVIGLGWDLRVGRSVSLTPFYNGFAMRNDNVDANVGQIGIGITFH